MQHLIRSFCVFLCTAFLAVTMSHGVTDARHSAGHAADWPAVALVDLDGGAGKWEGHVHVAPEGSFDETPADDVGNDGPVGHSHQIGGDSHAALPGAAHPLDDSLRSRLAARTPGVDTALGEVNRDGPEYPPKRMRTVV